VRKNTIIYLRALVVFAAVLMMISACKGKKSGSSEIDWSKTDFNGESVNLLTWEMYADPSFIKPFEAKYNCKVNPTFFATSDDLLAKIKAGGGDNYDVISPSGDMAGYFVETGLVEPVDLSHISGWADIPDDFKLSDMVKDGQVYGIPYQWGPDYIMYNEDYVPEPIKSWKELWDPKYAGKISLHDDISNIYMIGLLLGDDKPDRLGLYNMSDKDLEYAQQQLILLNKSVRKYWSDGGELEDLFANGEVVLGVGWPSTRKKLLDQGLKMGWCIPQEGCTGWFDHLMIVAGSKHEQLATLWIDWCTSPQGDALGAISSSFCVANPKAAEYMTEEQREASSVDDMSKMLGRINFWSYVKNREAYNEVWTAVKTSK